MGKLEVHIYIDADLMIWLRAQARAEGSSVSHYIRWCIYETKARTEIMRMKKQSRSSSEFALERKEAED